MGSIPPVFGINPLLFAMVAAAAIVLVGMYATFTVRDPMAKRVKALNARREQLKAGITASTRKRARLTSSNETTDRMRAFLASFKVLQDSQLKTAQAKLMQAGIRSKDAAITVIFARMLSDCGHDLIFGRKAENFSASGNYITTTELFHEKTPSLGSAGHAVNPQTSTSYLRPQSPDRLHLLWRIQK